MKAADKGHAAVVTHLIKHGADVTHTDNVRINFPLLSQPLFAESHMLCFLSFSIQSKFTALHLAAKANMTKAVEVLLSSAVAFVIINAQDVVRCLKQSSLLYAVLFLTMF